MITATCINTECEWNGVPRNTLGVPDRVMCGDCESACVLSDERDDPPMPDDLPVGV